MTSGLGRTAEDIGRSMGERILETRGATTLRSFAAERRYGGFGPEMNEYLLLRVRFTKILTVALNFLPLTYFKIER
jgi:predicted alpha/beta hydrolase